MDNWLRRSVWIFEDNFATPPVLTRTHLREILYLYLAYAEEVVSVILIRDFDANQSHVYFVSKAFAGAKTQYQKIENTTLVLVISLHKLQWYFLAHSIVFRMDLPLK